MTEKLNVNVENLLPSRVRCKGLGTNWRDENNSNNGIGLQTATDLDDKR